MSSLTVRVTPDFLATELLRAALKHIRDEHERDKFGFSVVEAAEVATQALVAAEVLERQGACYGA